MVKEIQGNKPKQEEITQQPAAPGRLWAGDLLAAYAHGIPGYHEHVKHIREILRLKRNDPVPDDWFIVFASTKAAGLTPEDLVLRERDLRDRQHFPGISCTPIFTSRKLRNNLLAVMRYRFNEPRDHLYIAEVGKLREAGMGHVDVVYSPSGTDNGMDDGNKLHTLIVARDPQTGRLVPGSLPMEVRAKLASVFQHENKGWPSTVLEIARSSRKRNASRPLHG